MIPQPTSRQVGVHPLPTPHLLWLAPSPLCGDNPWELSSSHHALSTWAIGEASLSPTGAVSRVADGTPKGIATHHLVNTSLFDLLHKIMLSLTKISQITPASLIIIWLVIKVLITLTYIV